jgi:hypothetical protein
VAAQYRCAHGAWPTSAQELRALASDGRAAISNRAWEILDLCRFSETNDGMLLINGRFDAGAPPFPDSAEPIELNFRIESGDCDLDSSDQVSRRSA